MKKLFFVIIALIILSVPQIKAQSPFTYISPIPGSKFHPLQTTILLRTGKAWSKINPEFCTVKGSVSAEIKCSFSLLEDQGTLLIKPVKAFMPDEKITVNIQPGFAKEMIKENYSFDFFTSALDENLYAAKLKEYYNTEEIYKYITNSAAADFLSKNAYKGLSVDINNQPEEGYIFMRNSGARKPANRYTSVLDKNAEPVFSLQDSSRGYCFQLQKNGYLSYFNLAQNSWEILDSSFNVFDTVYCANGYKADLHDFIITADNHCLLMAYDPQPFDMSTIVPDGNPQANVIGFIIQELDAEKNLVFQWRSWDYFKIEDAPHLDLKQKNIDYVHGNSFEIDRDGHIFFSSRHLDEVTKINRNTGAFIWRMGGLNNEFTFTGDSTGFCYQHDARRLANGNVSVFDNGNFHQPKISSVKEYVIDESAKTATLAWNFTHPAKIYARAMGNAQRLPGGNTWINWGLVNPGTPAITEVRTDGAIAWEATFNDSDNAYRSYKYQWQPKTSDISNNNEQNSSDKTYRLFPNPATNEITINGNFSGNFFITDVTGKEMYSGQNFVSGQTIKTDFLKPGIYFIKLIKPDNSGASLKLVKY